MANNIESDLQKMSANDIVLGTVGLIAGLIIAFLISQIYVGIKIPYLDVILNIITYITSGVSRYRHSDHKGQGHHVAAGLASEAIRDGTRARQDED